MKAKELLEQYKAGKRDFGKADLSEADLRGANLSRADLRGANLSRADLRGANLCWANLSGANLSRAELCWADLRGANLSRADLREANLRGAKLNGADLSEADLSEAELRGADLSEADLSDTILDPWAEVPELTDDEILQAGLEMSSCKQYVAGWRTARSTCVGNTNYSAKREYFAPVFSVDTTTPCHPGIYLGSKEWIRKQWYGTGTLVRCFCRRDELVHAGDKWRAKRIRVVKEEEHD